MPAIAAAVVGQHDVEMLSDAQTTCAMVGFPQLHLAHVEAAGDGAGLGMLSIEERARLVQGKVTVSSVPGEGTRVEVEAPVPED